MNFKADNVIFDIRDLEGYNFGKRYYFHDNLAELANLVANDDKSHIGTLMEISSSSRLFPFAVKVDGEILWTSLLYPVEEDAEERLSVYRPFNNLDELIQRWNFLNPCTRPAYTMPLIWVKHKNSETVELITAFCKDGVEMGSSYMTWGYFFDAMVFLDNTPCGVEIQEEV